ncbi:MAG TPA: hypothetical protein VGW34_15455 [Allosphingosinicella sp.]|nr:hypothetical protein [Allosphingosinicella sp.]
MIILGTAGGDQLSGTAAADDIHGFEGFDFLDGMGGEDFLYGGDHNDRLTGGEGFDRLRGEAGDDSYELLDLSHVPLFGGFAYDSVIELADAGLDTVSILPIANQNPLFGIFSYTLPENVEDGVIRSRPDDEPNADPLPFDLIGNELNNSLNGNTADNILTGEAGDDELYGNRGRDRLLGGAGNDTYLLDDAAPLLLGGIVVGFAFDAIVEDAGAGFDLAWIFTEDLGPELRAYALPDNVEFGRIEGGADFDLAGNDLDNSLAGGGGANRLTGAAGSDVILGAAGNDMLHGGGDSDMLRGGEGNDALTGGASHDYMSGGPGDDRLDGGGGFDRVSFNLGVVAGVTVDLALQGAAQNTGEGMDTLLGVEHVTGTRFGDVLNGDGAANWLWGGWDGVGTPGNDIIAGRGGDDLIQVGPGAHRLNGGAGTDTVSFDENALDIGPEGATISLLLQGTAQETGHGETVLVGFENVSGSSLDDRLFGDGNANLLAGAGGSDFLLGGGGSDVLLGDGSVSTGVPYSGPIRTLADSGGSPGRDVLDGGAGADLMRGGGGGDSYTVDDAGDRVLEAVDGGVDTVTSAISFSLGSNLENLILGGRSASAGTGNGMRNSISGNASANLLNGGGGSDLLTGGRGDDRFVFDSPLNPRLNVDRIQDFSPADDTVMLDRADFAGIAAIGALAPAAFRAGTAARDASDRIVYDAATGRIFYDADGSGGAAQLLFARVDPGTSLTRADFFVFTAAAEASHPSLANTGLVDPALAFETRFASLVERFFPEAQIA